MSVPSTLLATAGTSILRHAPEGASLGELVDFLRELPWDDTRAGAELNSLLLLRRQAVDAECYVHYFLTDTEEARLVGEALKEVIGPDLVTLHQVPDLDPRVPERFARQGLCHLASALGRVLRSLQPQYCAIDVTGGMKAQVGVAVTLGQALQVPVYYRHETFPQVISLPPLPISMDVGLWSGEIEKFFELAEDLAIWSELPPDPRLQVMLDWTLGDEGCYLVGLNPTGVIFHEAMLHRWPEVSRLQLPPPAETKEAPRIREHNWPDRQRLYRTMERLTERIPYIRGCGTDYLNPDLPGKNRFFLRGDRLLAECSDGTHTARFEVQTTARSREQRQACLADLLHRLLVDGTDAWLW